MLPSSQYFKMNNKIFCFAWGYLRRTNKTTFCSLRQEQDTKTLLWKKNQQPYFRSTLKVPWFTSLHKWKFSLTPRLLCLSEDGDPVLTVLWSRPEYWVALSECHLMIKGKVIFLFVKQDPWRSRVLNYMRINKLINLMNPDYRRRWKGG